MSAADKLPTTYAVSFAGDDFIGHVDESAGGAMADTDDILKRLGAVEATVSDVRARVEGVQATLQSTLPHLATKADLGKLETAMERSLSRLETATEKSLGKLETAMAKAQGANEATIRRLVMWYVGTQFAVVTIIVTLVVTLVKYLP